MAERFKDEPYLMGYDLLNEPWPGTPWLTCANNAGCPVFDTETLTPFSRLVTDRIREVDQRNIVWYEPNVLFNNGPETYHGDVAGEAGMSFHVYCLEEGANSPDTDPQQNAARGGDLPAARGPAVRERLRARGTDRERSAPERVRRLRRPRGDRADHPHGQSAR